MYADVLKYEIIDTEIEYYADKEDAYDMVLFFDNSVRDTVIAEIRAKHIKNRNEKLNKAETKNEESKETDATVEI